jgi:DNA-binding MarR family transcriptional regulator
VTTEPLHLDQQVCFALHAATRAMVGAYQPLLAELGVTYPQYLVLLVLWEEGTVRVSRLGERLHLDSGTLTPMLKRLEAQGIVERRRSAEDERVVDIHLTAAGKRLRKKAESIPEAIACKAALPLDELVRLRKTLHSLTSKLVASQEKVR